MLFVWALTHMYFLTVLKQNEGKPFHDLNRVVACSLHYLCVQGTILQALIMTLRHFKNLNHQRKIIMSAAVNVEWQNF